MAADPYGILGLKRDASAEAIKAAYRKLARKHHPDLNPGKPEAEARFKAVSAAHDLLSDPDKRGRFDRGEIDAEGQEQRPTAGYRRHADAAQGARYDGQSGGSPFDDLFADMFEARRRAESAPRPGQDESYRLDVTFIDAMLGTTTPMRLPDGRWRSLLVVAPSGPLASLPMQVLVTRPPAQPVAIPAPGTRSVRSGCRPRRRWCAAAGPIASAYCRPPPRCA